MLRRKPKARHTRHSDIVRRKKVIGLMLAFISVLTLISLLTHSVEDDKQILAGSVNLVSIWESSQLVFNQGGAVGAFLSYLFYFAFGWGSYLVFFFMFSAGWWIWKQKRPGWLGMRTIMSAGLVMLLLTLFDSISNFSDLTQTQNRTAIDILTSAGGYFSLKLNFFLTKILGELGSILLLAVGVLLLTMHVIPGSVSEKTLPAVEKFARILKRPLTLLMGAISNIWKTPKPRLADGVASDIDEDFQDDEYENRMRAALRPAADETPEPRLRSSEEYANIPGDRVKKERGGESGENLSLPFQEFGQSSDSDFKMPDINLLEDPPQLSMRVSQSELSSTANELRATLATFGIKIMGNVDILPGPVVTRYEFRPAIGVKVNQVLGLADDLALALRAKRIRIVAPIPGKAAVGIEIPNASIEPVYLKDIISSRAYKSGNHALPIALGKTISGEPFVSDLAVMPHLLIAGATGAGKSVCINAIITSLLYRHSPRDLRFLFIDPKMLELSVYAGIPHLERPVLTDSRKAERALAEAVAEMEARYKKLAARSVRHILDYNRVVEDPSETLPYLVIVIDELADLMMSQSSTKCEMMITRLAQMARAVGIHLILATQRPSVDVITGLIKANFPARLAFRVASKTDSRTILDANGAEKLLGKGDLLFLQSGQSEPTRIHGAYISGAETVRIVQSISEQDVQVAPIEELAGKEDEPGNERNGREIKVDPIYREAVSIVLHHKQASVSLLQRRLGIG
ncbi:MAG: DNA translocase FtsK 4TM domain-containing protein, partial [candidate division Zixibacteria bacterium]|nr:DNA translocase FtsK 4TM domain-containing protein [candidate division Zixibacteria bacterium]